MRVALTREFVRKIVVPERPIDYRDTRLKDFLLRVMPSGVKSWYCEYSRGKHIWFGRADAVGYSEANDAAQAIMADFYRGIDPAEARKPPVEVPTLEAFLDGDYATWARANQRAHVQNLARLKTAFKGLLSRKLHAITGVAIERWRGGKVERCLSHETINRDNSSIKACWTCRWSLIKRGGARKRPHRLRSDLTAIRSAKRRQR